MFGTKTFQNAPGVAIATAIRLSAINPNELGEPSRRPRAIIGGLRRSRSRRSICARGQCVPPAWLGIHILAAATRDQRASEVQALGHGVFSYALLRGLTGAAALRDADRRVTVMSLVAYIRDQLPDLGRKYQEVLET